MALEGMVSAPPETRHRSAALVPASWDAASRTVDVVWSTGAPVSRRDARGPYLEILSMDSAHVDLGGLDAAPVLDGHNVTTTRATLGTVAGARIDGGSGVATLRFTAAQDVAPILERIADGTLSAVSVGYRVSQWTESTDAAGRRVKTATRWRPHEISLVPIGADPGARIRSHHMPDANINPTPADDTGNRAETNRVIRGMTDRHGLGRSFADDLIDFGVNVPGARAAVLAEIERRAADAPHIRATVTGDSNDDPEVIGTLMADALAHRMGAPGDLPEASRAYRGMGLHDMARAALAARGERVTGLPTDALLARAMVTGDLPTLLQSSGARTLMASYTTALSPVFQMFRQTSATDFRTMSRIRLGEMTLLERVAENGEVTRGDTGETVESYAIATFAKTFALTRQAIINDDLGAFAQVTAQQGRAAAETMNNEALKLLTQGGGLGPTMSDAQRLFHVSHGNVSGAASAVDPGGLAAGVQAMRLQKGVDGKTPINATPRFLLVGPAREFAARQAVASSYPATAATSNPLSGTLEVAVDPRLSGNRWYLFADPAVMPVLEYAFLASAPGPQFESRQGWDVLGTEFRVHLDFGCGVLDWRGAYTNAGA